MVATIPTSPMDNGAAISFSPSLPRLSMATRTSLASPPFSHRSPEFVHRLRGTQQLLRAMFGGPDLSPVLVAGNGTLANDIMLASMASGAKRPAVLSNGEFGRRLATQCAAFHRGTLVCEGAWGAPFDPEAVSTFLHGHPDVDRIFMVALETSAGVLNPVADLAALAGRHGALVGLDAVSALSAVPVDCHADNIAVVTGTSGKGLAAVAGVALLFVRPSLVGALQGGGPHSLDLCHLWAAEHVHGVRNTLASPLLWALHSALQTLSTEGLDRCYERQRRLKRIIIDGMTALGLPPLQGSTSPPVTTFRRPGAARWRRIQGQLAEHGLEVYDSAEYLTERDCFQIATYGHFVPADVERLLMAVSAASSPDHARGEMSSACV